MEQQIRAVLFDMDGLMFDTERLGDEVWRAVAGKYGVTMTPEDVSLLRGRNYESGRRAFLERFGAGFPYDDMSAEVWREVEARLEHSVPLRPGLIELLDALRARNCMVLEDSYNGVRAGAAAGCFTVMVPDMDPPTPEMERLAWAIVPGLTDVARLLEQTDLQKR